MVNNEINEYRDIAIEIANILDDKKAQEILLLNVSNLSNLADWFVLATGLNSIHIKALGDLVEEKLAQKGVKMFRKEGTGEWIVLDFDLVIVHLFTAELRAMYHLEKLWNDGKNAYTLASISKLLEKERKQVEKIEKKVQKKEDKEVKTKVAKTKTVKEKKE